MRTDQRPLSLANDLAWVRGAIANAVTGGERFGPYEVLGRLASGATATVSRARHVDLNRIVALKVMKGADRAEPAEVQRFRFGAAAAVGLEHPNIARIRDVGEHDGVPYLAMDLIEGQTLARSMERLREDLVSAVALLAKVARAIQHAHEHGVLHRDLKPENIVLDEQGEPFVVDFGFAKHLDERASTSKPSILVGTMGYMSPEQACAGRSLTFASDIYALGAILYELLTGQTPYRKLSLVDLIQQLVGPDPVPAPRTIQKSVDRELEFICLKCLEKNWRRRYANATELEQDLERWLRGEPPVGMGSERILARTARWCRAHPALATMLAGTITVLAATAKVALDGAREFEQALLSDVLRANADNAQARADQVRYQLRELSLAAARCAADPRVGPLFAPNAAPAPAAHADRLLIECGAKTLFDSVALIDRAGNERARLPHRARPVTPAQISEHDLFLGPKRNAESGFRWIHVGRVLRSEDGDGGRRVSIAAPVFDEDNQWLGVVHATLAVKALLEALQLRDSGRGIAVLVGRREFEPGDPPESRADGVLVLLHKEREETLAAGRGSPWQKLVKRVKEAAGRDPLRFSDPKPSLEDDARTAPVTVFGKRWLAAFAPVGDTGLGVVVQTQYEDATKGQLRALVRLLAWTGGVFSLGALAVVVLARTLGHRTRRRI